MDPIQSILLGLLTNGLTTFIAQFARRDSKLLLGKELYNKIKWEQTALEPILQKATNILIESIEWQGTLSVEVVCLFLSSPEAEAIVRQIYAAQFLESEAEANWSSIQKEFLASFYLFVTAYPAYADLQEAQLVEPAKRLIKLLVNGCEQVLTAAIDNGVLAAHEAKAVFRHRMLLEEIAMLQENVTFLTAQQKPNIQAILEFERKYRQQVGERHRYIIPPNFDRTRKLPLDDLYVQPKVLPNKKIEGSEVPTELTMAAFLSGIYRAVLLGNPGGGKSTFTFKLCHDLVNRYSERVFAERKEITPILVVLRDYGAMKRTHHCSILEFIKLKANSDYQTTPPSSAFEYLLLNGRAIVIFDGLDELLDTHYRQEISSDVESFCSLYPSVPVLVTSREVGYEQAPLDEDRFEVFRLASFDNEQVHEYINKWFDSITELTQEQKNQKTDAFFTESEFVPDLRSNPLMLALLCNIYREENYIPKNRPDVYEKCATMLFERWDKSRGIQVPLPFEAHIRPAMMYLAHWIYADESLRSGVTEEKLVEKTTEYLCQKLFEDTDEARIAAKEFIAFCRGRAWVFTDTGTTKEGEKLYQFTHQTFLEYFTAAYVSRTHSTPSSLLSFLQQRIVKREWDVVAQLAFHIQNKNVEGAGDKLLTSLAEQARKDTGDKGWALLSFAVRCLEFIIPNPKVIQMITFACIEHSLTWGIEQIKHQSLRKEGKPYGKHEPEELFRDLLFAASDNRRTIAASLEKLLVEYINTGSEYEALIALEIVLELTTFLTRISANPNYIVIQFRKSKVKTEDLHFWKEISDRIFNNCWNKIEPLCHLYLQIWYDAFDRERVTISDCIKWLGTENLFRGKKLIIFPNTSWFSIPENVLNDYDIFSPGRSLKTSEKLTELGRVLLHYTPPWSVQEQRDDWHNPFFYYPNWAVLEESDSLIAESAKPSSIDSDVLFGIFVVFATLFEANNCMYLPKGAKHFQKIEKSEKIKSIKNNPYPLFDFIRWIFVAREESTATDKVQAEIDKSGFTAEQQEFIWRWVRKEIDLVRQELSERDDTSENSNSVITV